MKLWSISLVVLLVGGASYGFVWYSKYQASRLDESRLGEVKKGDVVVRASLSGQLAPKHKAVIMAPYTGFVRKIYVKVGDQVRAGDPIVALSQTATARGEELLPQRSPIDGTVTQILYSEGEYIDRSFTADRGPAIARIDDQSGFYVETQAPEVEYGRLKVGQEAEIRILALSDKTIKGKVDTISLASKDQSQWERTKVEFIVRILILEPSRELRGGMSAAVDVFVSQAHDTLTLPIEFVRKDGDKHTVTLPDGKVVDVKVGLRDESNFEIKEGIAEGAKVKPVDYLAIGKG